MHIGFTKTNTTKWWGYYKWMKSHYARHIVPLCIEPKNATNADYHNKPRLHLPIRMGTRLIIYLITLYQHRHLLRLSWWILPLLLLRPLGIWMMMVRHLVDWLQKSRNYSIDTRPITVALLPLVVILVVTIIMIIFHLRLRRQRLYLILPLCPLPPLWNENERLIILGDMRHLHLLHLRHHCLAQALLCLHLILF